MTKLQLKCLNRARKTREENLEILQHKNRILPRYRTRSLFRKGKKDRHQTAIRTRLLICKSKIPLLEKRIKIKRNKKLPMTAFNCHRFNKYTKKIAWVPHQLKFAKESSSLTKGILLKIAQCLDLPQISNKTSKVAKKRLPYKQTPPKKSKTYSKKNLQKLPIQKCSTESMTKWVGTLWAAEENRSISDNVAKVPFQMNFLPYSIAIWELTMWSSLQRRLQLHTVTLCMDCQRRHPKLVRAKIIMWIIMTMANFRTRSSNWITIWPQILHFSRQLRKSQRKSMEALEW